MNALNKLCLTCQVQFMLPFYNMYLTCQVHVMGPVHKMYSACQMQFLNRVHKMYLNLKVQFMRTVYNMLIQPNNISNFLKFNKHSFIIFQTTFQRIITCFKWIHYCCKHQHGIAVLLIWIDVFLLSIDVLRLWILCFHDVVGVYMHVLWFVLMICIDVLLRVIGVDMMLTLLS